MTKGFTAVELRTRRKRASSPQPSPPGEGREKTTKLIAID
jgi:hypothetical protein